MQPLVERDWLSAAAHITGGGLTENLPRVLPPGCAAEIHLDRWPVPPLFRTLERLGGLAPDEMLRTLNMGIGMVLIVPPRHLAKVETHLRERRSAYFPIGEVVRGGSQVRNRGHWQ